MHVDAVEYGGHAEPGARPSRTGGHRGAWRGFRPDGFEAWILVAFAVLSLWVLALDLWHTGVDGRVWTGTDGLFLTDQMQYIAWIQAASQHFFISDLFVLHGSSPDYLQPLVILSAVLTRLGVAAWLTLLLWQPVAVVAIFFVARAFARACLPSTGQRHAALAIALFGGFFPLIGDLWLVFWSWGYAFPLIGIASSAAALLLYARARDDADVRIWPAAACGVLASWLHPWQGETLILIIGMTECLLWLRSGRRPAKRTLALALMTVIATLLPLLYYVALAHLDPQWGLARVGSKHLYSVVPLLEALAPLLLASAPAYRRWPEHFLPVAVRLWLPAAAVVFVVSESGLSATPLHAFAGITIPLSILSVEGVMSVIGRWLSARAAVAWLLVAAVTVPTSIAELKGAPPYISPSLKNANFIAREDRDALRYLAGAREPGGVFTRAYLGLITPPLTGRHTYLGTCQWSEPGCPARTQIVHNVFQTPGVTAAAIRAAVLATHARFVLNSTCTMSGKDLDGALAPISSAVIHFGCATVYRISAPGG